MSKTLLPILKVKQFNLHNFFFYLAYFKGLLHVYILLIIDTALHWLAKKITNTYMQYTVKSQDNALFQAVARVAAEYLRSLCLTTKMHGRACI